MNAFDTGTPVSILLVDQNAQFRSRLKQALEQVNCTVMIARDSNHAVALLQKAKQISVILLDMDMPHMDAVVLLKKLSATAKYVDMAVFALSDRDTDAVRMAAMVNGCARYLNKGDTSIAMIVQEVLAYLRSARNRER